MSNIGLNMNSLSKNLLRSFSLVLVLLLFSQCGKNISHGDVDRTPGSGTESEVKREEFELINVGSSNPDDVSIKQGSGILEKVVEKVVEKEGEEEKEKEGEGGEEEKEKRQKALGEFEAELEKGFEGELEEELKKVNTTEIKVKVVAETAKKAKEKAETAEKEAIRVLQTVEEEVRKVILAGNIFARIVARTSAKREANKAISKIETEKVKKEVKEVKEEISKIETELKEIFKAIMKKVSMKADEKISMAGVQRPENRNRLKLQMLGVAMEKPPYCSGIVQQIQTARCDVETAEKKIESAKEEISRADTAKAEIQKLDLVEVVKNSEGLQRLIVDAIFDRMQIRK